MSDIADDRKLLQFSVGPVLCCADSISVYRIIEPPEHLVHLPGHSQHPTIFRHEGRVVTVIDMRTLFGLMPEQNKQGLDKLIIAEIDRGLFAYWVDEVSTIVSESDGKWGFLPSVVPRTLFDAAFNLQGKLILHVDFSKLVDADAMPWVYESGLYHEEVAEVEQDAQELSDIDLSPAPVAEVQKPIVRETTEEVVKREPIPAKESRPSERLAHSVAATTQVPRHETTSPSVARKTTAFEADSTPVESTTVREETQRPQPKMEDGPEWQTPYEVDAERIPPEPEQERSGWLLPVFVVLLLLLGAGYLLSSFLEEPPGRSHVSGSVPLEKQQPPVIAISEPAPVMVAEPEPEMIEAPVEDHAAEAVVVIDEVESTSSITREGDMLTITVYEDVQPEVIAEPGKPEDAVPDKIQATEGVAVTQEDIAAGVVEPVEEGLKMVWSSPRQALVDEASEAEQPSSVDGETQALVVEALPLRPVLTIEEIVHVVVKGDTLWDIAERYIRDPLRYPELARLSKINNPDLIYPGDRVRIRIIRHATGNGGQ